MGVLATTFDQAERSITATGDTLVNSLEAVNEVAIVARTTARLMRVKNAQWAAESLSGMSAEDKALANLVDPGLDLSFLPDSESPEEK